MKNVSKICLGLIAIFSLTACGKGKKVTKEEFFEEVANLKTDKHKKATIIVTLNSKSGDKNDLLEEKRKATGSYVKDETGSWDSDSETNGSYADMAFSSIVENYHLKQFNYFGSFYSSSGTNAKEDEKYYIKPFSFDSYEKEERDYDDYDYDDYVYYDHDYDNNDSSLSVYRSSSGSFKYTRIRKYHFEWDDYGYVTFIEFSEETRKEYKNKTTISNETSTAKISYK